MRPWRSAVLTRACCACCSIDVRANPRLCGLLPPGLRTVAVPKGPWEGFCAKAYTEDDSSCSLLTTPGTALGKPCG